MRGLSASRAVRVRAAGSGSSSRPKGWTAARGEIRRAGAAKASLKNQDDGGQELCALQMEVIWAYCTVHPISLLRVSLQTEIFQPLVCFSGVVSVSYCGDLHPLRILTSLGQRR